MSAIGGPNIVEDGLVLALDAANVKSFRGEPTVNLIHNPSFIDNSGNSIPDGYSTSGTLSSGDGTIETNNGVITIYNPPSGRAFIVPSSSNLSNLEDGKTYTFSVTIHRADTNFRFAWVSNNSNIRINDLIDASKSLPQRVSFTFTSNGTNTIRLGTGVSNNDSEGIVQFSQPQLEEKPYPTPFVDGTRGTTVATGGGWADRSGNNNHGELVNGPTFDSDNLGSLVFDGVDDTIQIGDTSTTSFIHQSGKFAINIWIQPLGIDRRQEYITTASEGNDAGIVIEELPSPAGRVRVRFYPQTGNNSERTDVFFNLLGEQWQYINIIGNGNDLNTYINGKLKSNSNINALGSGNTTLPLKIGGFTNGRFFNGNISQVQIYNRALTPEEILQNYNATKGRYGL